MTNTSNTLINLTGVRAAIKRAFNGSVSEILAELLQNSQRAKATVVKIETTNETVFRYEDNGQGILSQDDLIALIKIGETGWDETVQKNQHPMGLGLHALLAHEQVTHVCIESGGRKIEIDTTRWWEDFDYAQNWLERVGTSKRKKGFKLTVTCKAKFNSQVKEVFYYGSSKTINLLNLASGYCDYLVVLVNGQKVNPKFNPAESFETFLLETEIFGNKCYIGHQPHGLKPTGVNWYGQLISYKPIMGKNTDHPFGIFFDVKDGCPLDTQSPTRNGFIRNEKLAAFDSQIILALEEYFETTPFEQISPSILSCFLYRNPAYRGVSRYFTAEKVLALDGMENSQDDLDKTAPYEIFSYENAPLLVENTVEVIIAGKEDAGQDTCEKGVSSFIGMTGELYFFDQGDQDRLPAPMKLLWWKHEAALAEMGQIVEPGEWGWGIGDAQPTEWQPVTQPVMVVEDADNWNINNANFKFAGLTAVEFLRSNWPWLAFDSYHEDYDTETIEESFRESITATLREIDGNAIPPDFKYSDVQGVIGHKNTILTIRICKTAESYYASSIIVKYVDEENLEHELELKTLG